MTTEIVLQTIVSGLLMGFIYALVAAGLSLIFGLMEIVNFAHGEFMMLSMYAAFWLYAVFGLDPLFSIPICAPTSAHRRRKRPAICRFASARLPLQIPFRGKSHVQP